MIAEMERRVAAARLLMLRASWRRTAGLPHTLDASMAKLYASEAATFCAHRAIQIHGGYGYVKEYPVERYYRDARMYRDLRGSERDPAARHRARVDPPAPKPADGGAHPGGCPVTPRSKVARRRSRQPETVREDYARLMQLAGHEGGAAGRARSVAAHQHLLARLHARVLDDAVAARVGDRGTAATTATRASGSTRRRTAPWSSTAAWAR